MDDMNRLLKYINIEMVNSKKHFVDLPNLIFKQKYDPESSLI